MIRLICIFLLIFLGNAFQVCHGALPAVSKVLHIGYVAGLSSQRVYSIVEDKNHAIWISTKSGVDRYNGQTLKIMPCPTACSMATWQPGSSSYPIRLTAYYGPMIIRAGSTDIRRSMMNLN